MKRLAGLICVLGVCQAWAQEPYQVPEPKPVSGPILVGSYYFPGHFNAARWVPMARARFPMPLLGYYRDGDPVVSDWHIKWALEHGISFFAFDWYYDYRTGNVLQHNNALELGFLRARYRDLMKFAIFWCNEEQWEPDYTDEQMMVLARTLRDRYFRQPNYLKFNGKPALFISQPRRLTKRFGVEGCAAIWHRMSAEAGVEILPIALAYDDQETLAKAGSSRRHSTGSDTWTRTGNRRRGGHGNGRGDQKPRHGASEAGREDRGLGLGKDRAGGKSGGELRSSGRVGTGYGATVASARRAETRGSRSGRCSRGMTRRRPRWTWK